MQFSLYTVSTSKTNFSGYQFLPINPTTLVCYYLAWGGGGYKGKKGKEGFAYTLHEFSKTA